MKHIWRALVDMTNPFSHYHVLFITRTMTREIDKRHKLEMPWQTTRREYGQFFIVVIGLAIGLLLIVASL